MNWIEKWKDNRQSKLYIKLHDLAHDFIFHLPFIRSGVQYQVKIKDRDGLINLDIHVIVNSERQKEMVNELWNSKYIYKLNKVNQYYTYLSVEEKY